MTLPADAASLPPLREFDGPLDLLLEEVRRQKVAIEEIAMAPLVARYLEYVRRAAGENLRLDVEWLHIAAILIYWKSRTLLHRDASAEPQKDPIRDDLVEQILAHSKQAAEDLARRRTREENRFSRGTTPIERGDADSAVGEADEAGFVSVWDLIQQARGLARWAEQHREDRRRWRESFGVEQDDTSVTEMMDYLRDQLAAGNGSLDGVGLLESQAMPSAGPACSSECWRWRAIDRSKSSRMRYLDRSGF